jgi:hypothetical protein
MALKKEKCKDAVKDFSLDVGKKVLESIEKEELTLTIGDVDRLRKKGSKIIEECTKSE